MLNKVIYARKRGSPPSLTPLSSQESIKSQRESQSSVRTDNVPSQPEPSPSVTPLSSQESNRVKDASQATDVSQERLQDSQNVVSQVDQPLDSQDLLRSQ